MSAKHATMSATAKKTDPALWEKVKKEVTESDKGGKPGQWSARKAQAASGAVDYGAQPDGEQPVQQDLDGPTPQGTPQVSKTEDSVGLKWRILLMLALAIPVFLETLDYTGEWLHTL